MTNGQSNDLLLCSSLVVSNNRINYEENWMLKKIIDINKSMT